jgi:hypothetical protein
MDKQVREPLAIVPLAYPSVRLRWSVNMLVALLRRWGIYIVVGLVVLGSGAMVGLGAIAALLGLSVAPLFHAAGQPLAVAVLITLAHSLAGALIVLAARPLLWPRSWAEAEAALPISRDSVRRSDLMLVTLALTPLFGLYLGGMLAWLAQTAGRSGRSLIVIGLLVVSGGLSLCWGLLVLRGARVTQRSTRIGLTTRSTPTRDTACTPLGVLPALLVKPMLRGPATRTFRLLLLGVLTLAALVTALAWWPPSGGWWLAAFGAAGLILSARLRGLIEADLAPLHAACAALPLAPRHLQRLREALALTPVLLGLGLLAGLAALSRPGTFNTPVLVAFLGATLAFNLLQLRLAGRRQPIRASTWAALWLTMLVVLLALASEAMR